MENLQVRWLTQSAVRNDQFKLVQTIYEDCNATNPNTTSTVYDLYEIDQAVQSPYSSPKLDTVDANLITSQSPPTQGLTPEQAKNFKLLERKLNRILASEPECPGDGNNDGVVDMKDVWNWLFYNLMHNGNDTISSWYDFSTLNSDGAYVYDGDTDEMDLKVILENLGRKCPRK